MLSQLPSGPLLKKKSEGEHRVIINNLRLAQVPQMAIVRRNGEVALPVRESRVQTRR
jgi:hypothetical protein